MHSTGTSQKNDQIPSQPVRSLWRNRDFLLLWSGQTVSTLGTNISALALPLLVLALTHSPALAGFVAATRQVPYLLVSLPAGSLVDRWDRKKTMIYCDLLRWLALGTVPLAFVLGHLTLIHLYLVAFIEGTAYVLFTLSQISALPQVVDRSHLPQAYALDTTTEYLGTLLGPGLSAFIIGLVPIITIGAILAYLVDSLSYLASVFTLLGMRVSFQVERVKSRQPSSLLGEIAEGLRFLWKQHDLRLLAGLTAIVNFLLSSVDLALIVLAQSRLHLSVQFIGLILSAGGIGGLLSSFIAPWLHKRFQYGPILLGSVIAWCGATALLAFAPWPALLLVGKFLISFTWPGYGVAVVSYRLLLTPDDLQGRVNSAFRNVTYGCEALGSACGGIVLALIGAQAMFGCIAVGFAGCILFTILTGLTGLRKG